KLFALGAALFAGGLIAGSFATALWQLYLWYGLVASLGTTILGLSNYAALLSRWFRKQRGLALGIAFAGTGAGTFLVIPLTERAISAWGWQWAMIGQGVLLLGVVLPLSLFFLRLRPADMGLAPDGEPMVASPAPLPAGDSKPSWTLKAARSTWAFWLILVSGWGALFSLRMLTVHQVAVAVDAGIDRFIAAAVMGGSGIVTVIAFIGWGAISDRLGRRRTFVLSSATLALAFVILLAVKSAQDLPLLYLYALMLGLGEGSRSSLIAAVVNDTFPGEAGGQITGYVGMAFGAGAAMGSWSAGVIFDISGSYNDALWLGLAVTLLSAGCMAVVSWLARRGRLHLQFWFLNLPPPAGAGGD
ncbi:MAG: MFS transporter, partial [Anaerolineae bacterium]